jgi:hypothetical protein
MIFKYFIMKKRYIMLNNEVLEPKPDQIVS